MSYTRRFARLLAVRTAIEARQSKPRHAAPETSERRPLSLGAPDR